MFDLETHSVSVHQKQIFIYVNGFQFKCDECDNNFTLKRSLQLHVKTVHLRMKEYLCYECSRAFAKKFTLNCHIQRRHAYLVAEKCQDCNFHTFHHDDLETHSTSAHKKHLTNFPEKLSCL